MATRRAKLRLTEQVAIRFPQALPAAIEAGAERRFVSVSEYIRLAVIHQLEGDGIDIRGIRAAAA